jgi:hypothetical protein
MTMRTRLIRARDLKDGMVLALPMDKTATVQGDPKIGRRFVTITTEYGTSRVMFDDEVLIEDVEQPRSVHELAAIHLTTPRLADDLQRVAENPRYFSPDQRRHLLLEAARRLRMYDQEAKRSWPT